MLGVAAEFNKPKQKQKQKFFVLVFDSKFSSSIFLFFVGVVNVVFARHLDGFG